MPEFVQPLDLERILVNNLAGSMEVFMLLAFIFIAVLGAYFRMINSVVLIMYVLFAIFMAQYLQGLYFLVVLIGGIFAFWAIAKIVKN